jgi:hypothetical protein
MLVLLLKLLNQLGGQQLTTRGRRRNIPSYAHPLNEQRATGQ